MNTPLPDGSLRDMLRPHVPDAAREIEQAVRDHLLTCSSVPDTAYAHAIRHTIDETVSYFVDRIGWGEPDWARVVELYARLGADGARRGYQLDLMQSALRLSSQVACRRFIKDAYRLDWPKETLASLTDLLFELLARAADACGQGFAEQRGKIASDRDRRRAQLRDSLVREPGVDAESVNEQARAAGWRVPCSVSVVVLLARVPAPGPILPPDVLADWEQPRPYLIVPDPVPARHERLCALLAPLGAAAVGPAVPTAGAAVSLRWARHGAALIERGVLPPERPLWCVDHIALLAASMAEELIDVTAEAVLGAFLALPPQRREPLLTTLFTYLQCGENAVLTGRRLRIHEQTVRYRLRRIHELLGPAAGYEDPVRRLNLVLVLHWLINAGAAAPADQRRQVNAAPSR